MANPYKNYTQEDFIRILKDFHDKNNRSPMAKDMGSKTNTPSPTAFYKKFNTTHWCDILRKANLPLTNPNSFTFEEEKKSLDYLNNTYINKKRFPTRSEIKRDKISPKLDFFYSKYGTLENALFKNGYIDAVLNDNDKIQLAIDDLINFTIKYNRYPTIQEYKQISHKGYNIQTLQKRLNMDYQSICRKYIPDFAPVEKEIATKELIIDELTRIYKLLGRPPKYNELKTYNCRYDFGVIQSRFEGMRYNEVIQSLGWIPSGSTSASKSDEELLNEFEQLFNCIGRVPTNYDFENTKDISTKSTYEDRFGSLQNVCELLGIDYDLYFINSGIGFKCNDLNGKLCKSIAELDITNYFIINNINFVKEPKYSEIIDNSNRRFDWKIELNNKWYYVEYFGLYNRIGKGKIVREYRKKTRNKISKIYTSGNINNCIFIFPYDLKHKSLDEIFKPYINNII
jgi:hypothetical protein